MQYIYKGVCKIILILIVWVVCHASSIYRVHYIQKKQAWQQRGLEVQTRAFSFALQLRGLDFMRNTYTEALPAYYIERVYNAHALQHLQEVVYTIVCFSPVALSLIYLGFWEGAEMLVWNMEYFQFDATLAVAVYKQIECGANGWCKRTRNYTFQNVWKCHWLYRKFNDIHYFDVIQVL